MKTSICFGIALTIAAWAAALPATWAAESHLEEEDHTGTNPAKFTRTLILYNEFR